MRVMVTGSREYTDEDSVHDALSDLLVGIPLGEHLTVIHGAAAGADSFASSWARTMKHHGVREERHPADWKGLGKSAGFVRNKAMVDSGPDILLAFYKEGAGNVGTQHSVNLAHQAGVKVITTREN